ncbi:MAG: hypothetical protein OIF32_06360 [Campylobacterales bacterium]|nr:hypothetical protein [Campylobacterales bacterium]
MNDIVIVSYHCDELDNYFQLCNEDIQTFIKLKQLDIETHCLHDECNRTSLHEKLNTLADNYVVSIYAHGENHRIRDNELQDLITIDDSMKYYNNAIVYSTACYSANEIGRKMHLYNCKIFYGYTKRSYVVYMYKDSFIELDNFALKEILVDHSIEPTNLCEKTNYAFDKKIEEMKDLNLMVAPLIMHNRESYKIYKNRQEYPA